jgi:hypothetical protein
LRAAWPTAQRVDQQPPALHEVDHEVDLTEVEQEVLARLPTPRSGVP